MKQMRVLVKAWVKRCFSYRLILTMFICLVCLYSISQSPRILVPYRMGNKWGYSDTLGKIKIQPRYDSVSLFDYDVVYKGNHVTAMARFNGKPMVINETGTVIVPPKYDYINFHGRSDEPAFFISKNGKWGLFTKGKELFPPIYDYMDVTTGIHYKVHRNNKWGLINSEGKLVIPVAYDDLREIPDYQTGMVSWEGITWGKENQKLYTFKQVGDHGPSEIPPQELRAVDIGDLDQENYSQVMEAVKKEHGLDSIRFKGNSGIVYKGDKQGIFLPKESKNVWLFSKQYNIHQIKYFETWARTSFTRDIAYIIADMNGKYGMIDEKENTILPFEYDKVEEKDGFFLLTRNGKIGFFILNTFYPVIQPAYDRYVSKVNIPVSSQWQFALFKVEKNDKQGFVGENGIAYFKD